MAGAGGRVRGDLWEDDGVHCGRGGDGEAEKR